MSSRGFPLDDKVALALSVSLTITFDTESVFISCRLSLGESSSTSASNTVASIGVFNSPDRRTSSCCGSLTLQYV